MVRRKLLRLLVYTNKLTSYQKFASRVGYAGAAFLMAGQWTLEPILFIIGFICVIVFNSFFILFACGGVISNEVYIGLPHTVIIHILHGVKVIGLYALLVIHFFFLMIRRAPRSTQLMIT